MSSQKLRLLVIDDDRTMCEVVKDSLEGNQFSVHVAHSRADGMALCAQLQPELVLLDQKLPDGPGNELCPQILEHRPDAKIIFNTAFPSFDNALQAIRAGAFDYLSKPYEIAALRLAISRAIKTLDLERVAATSRHYHRNQREQTQLVGAEGGLAEVDRFASQAASSMAPVLVTGETGTGKNIVARLIHYRSQADPTRLISVNCAALPDSLIESELFGVEKGAFTGADEARPGLFELADGGTLVLDEIGELPLVLQAKLLGVLEESAVRRVGGQRLRQFSTRIIAATNLDLETAIADGRFRSDLFYRIGVLHVHVPPLRDRLQDIPELCTALLSRIYGPGTDTLPPEELEALQQYRWPGNVRELRNVLERAHALREGGEPRPSELISRTLTAPVERQEKGANTGISTLAAAERKLILHALRAFGGNQTHAAAKLGISLSTLKRRLSEYGSSI